SNLPSLYSLMSDGILLMCSIYCTEVGPGMLQDAGSLVFLSWFFLPPSQRRDHILARLICVPYTLPSAISHLDIREGASIKRVSMWVIVGTSAVVILCTGTIAPVSAATITCMAVCIGYVSPHIDFYGAPVPP